MFHLQLILTQLSGCWQRTAVAVMHNVRSAPAKNGHLLAISLQHYLWLCEHSKEPLLLFFDPLKRHMPLQSPDKPFH